MIFDLFCYFVISRSLVFCDGDECLVQILPCDDLTWYNTIPNNSINGYTTILSTKLCNNIPDAASHTSHIDIPNSSCELWAVRSVTHIVRFCSDFVTPKIWKSCVRIQGRIPTTHKYKNNKNRGTNPITPNSIKIWTNWFSGLNHLPSYMSGFRWEPGPALAAHHQVSGLTILISSHCLSMAICPVLEYCLANICWYHTYETAHSPSRSGRSHLMRSFLMFFRLAPAWMTPMMISSMTRVPRAARENVSSILDP